MIRASTIGCVVVVLSMLSGQGRVDTQPKHTGSAPRVYSAKVGIYAEPARVRNACVVFGGGLSAGDFFEGLVRTETASGVHFQKESKEVTTFPDSLLLEVTADVHRSCKPPWGREGPYLQRNLMDTVAFKAQWNRDSSMREVDSFSVERHQPVWDESGNRYEYALRLKSAGVPLADELILSVSVERGAELARIRIKL
jgi:hypothetical protein